MKSLFLLPVVSLAVVFVPAHLEASAQNTKFFCGTNSGVPVTYARTSRGTVRVIEWKSLSMVGTGWTPARRCQEVSQRFQTFYQQGQLRFITSGIINNQDVICVTDRREKGTCRGLLLTLRPGSRPAEVLKTLFRISALADSSSVIHETDRTYIDVDALLEETSVDEVSGDEVSPLSNQLFL